MNTKLKVTVKFLDNFACKYLVLKFILKRIWKRRRNWGRGNLFSLWVFEWIDSLLFDALAIFLEIRRMTYLDTYD